MAFNKNELIEFIQGSLEMNQGLSPSMIKDIESVIKNQIEMDDADDYIKSLGNDNEKVRRLLEDVLDGTADVEPVVIIDSKSNTSRGTGSERASFRDALDEDIENNRSFMMMGHNAFINAISNVHQEMGGHIDTVLGEEKTNLIDPAIAMTRALSGFGDFGSFFETPEDRQFNVVKDSFDKLRNINSVSEKQLDLQENLSDKPTEVQNSIFEKFAQKLNSIYNINKEQVDIQKGVVNESVEKLDSLNATDQQQADLIQESIDAQNNIYKINKDAFDLAKEADLRLQREDEDDEDDGSWLGDFIKSLAIATAAGLALGGWLGAIVLPFQLLGNLAMSLGRSLGLLSSKAEDSISLFSRIGTALAKLMGKIPHIEKLSGFKNIWDGVKTFMDTMGSGVKVLLNANLGDAMEFFKKIPDLSDGMKGASEGASKLLHMGTYISNTLTKMGSFGETIKHMGSYIENLFTSLKNFFGGGGKFAKIAGILSQINIVSMFSPIRVFIDAFGVGFRLLGKFIAPLFALFDFLKGFLTSDADSFIGKVKDGLVEAIMGFVELPIKIVGWLYDKVLGLFGVESKGSGQAMVDGLRGFLNAITGSIGAIYTFIQSTLGNIVGLVKNLVGGVVRMIAAPFKWIFDTVVNVFTTIGDMIGGLYKAIVGVVKTVVAPIGGIIRGIFKLITGDLSGAFEELKGIGQALKSGIGMILDGILDIIKAPFVFIKETFVGIFDMIVDMLGGLLEMIKAPFIYISSVFDDLKAMLSTLLKDSLKDTMFAPFLDIIEDLTNFVAKIRDGVRGKLTSIPILGAAFASDEEKKVKEIEEDQARLIEIQERRIVLQEEQVKLDRQGGNSWIPFTTTYESIQKDNDKLSAEEAQITARLQKNKRVKTPATDKGRENIVKELAPTSVSMSSSVDETSTKEYQTRLTEILQERRALQQDKKRIDKEGSFGGFFGFNKTTYESVAEEDKKLVDESASIIKKMQEDQVVKTISTEKGREKITHDVVNTSISNQKSSKVGLHKLNPNKPKEAVAYRKRAKGGGTQPSPEMKAMFESASEKYGVPVGLIEAVAHTESRFKADAQSGAGAKGVMQLMDPTAKDLGVKDSFDPKQNIDGGTKYLGQLLKRYDGDQTKALQAYNFGMGNVDKGRALPKETRDYTVRVEKRMAEQTRLENEYASTHSTPTPSLDTPSLVADTPSFDTPSLVASTPTPSLDTPSLVASTPTPSLDTPTPVDHIPNQPTMVLEDLDQVDAAKAQAMINSNSVVSNTANAVNNLNKTTNEVKERPIVVNTGEQQRRVVEPPEDIEAMSILFLNKSWGLG